MQAYRILVVEDEVVVAMEIRAQLTAMGYSVVGIVGRGEEVMEVIGQTAPDLVLMDIKLAGEVDGIETARRIHRTHRIPIIYLTAHSDNHTLQRAKTSEPYGYLLKPFSKAELRTTIEVCLHKHSQHGKEREIADLFSSVLDSEGGAVIATDGNGMIRHINSLAQALTGWTGEDAVGRRLSDVYTLKDPETGSMVRDFSGIVTAHGVVSPARKHVLISKEDKEIPVESASLTVADLSGKAGTVVHCFRENSHLVEKRQDWVSHSANLRVAGRLCLSEGNLVEAEFYLKRALEITEQNVGRDNPKTAKALEDLPDVLRRLGRENEAKILEVRMNRIRAELDKSRAGGGEDVGKRHRPNNERHHMGGAGMQAL